MARSTNTLMKEKQWQQSYMCTGEDWSPYGTNIPIGLCGDIKTLIDWLMICFPGYEVDYVKEHFANYTVKGVLDYIQVSTKKQFEKV